MLQQPAIQPRNDDASAIEYSIGELAAWHDVSHRTLRFYEQRGLLCPTRRDGQRVYSRQDRIRLGVILLAKRLGFSLAEVSKLIQSRDCTPTCVCDATPTVAWLGLSKEQIGAQVAHLCRRRASVQRAIDVLREVASRGDRLV